MNSADTLAIGRERGAERWLEIRMNEEGGCSISLVQAGGDVIHDFPCSLETLRMIARGMSYQASSPEGYFTVTSYRGCISLYTRTSGDRKTWTYQITTDEFVEALAPLEKTAFARRRGYAA